MRKDLKRIYFAVLTAAVCSLAYADDTKGFHGEIDVTGALTLLKGHATTYNFISASPEIKLRYGEPTGGGYFVGLGSPLVTSLNKDPNSIQASQPESIFHSNLYVVLGRGWLISKGGEASVWKVPTTFSIGAGWMNQQINSTNAIYDKGGFIYLGFSAALLGW